MKLFTCCPRLRMGTWFLEPYRLNAGWEHTSVLIWPTRGCIRVTRISRRFLARPTSITFWFRFRTGLNGPWEGKRNYAGRSSRSGSAALRLALAPGDSAAAEMAHTVAVLRGMAVCLDGELVAAVDLPLRDSHPGGTADGAAAIRSAKYCGGLAGTLTEHYAANSQPHPI